MCERGAVVMISVHLTWQLFSSSYPQALSLLLPVLLIL